MTFREARPDELVVELFAPCEGSSVSKDGRATIRAPFGRVGVQKLPTFHPMLVVPMEIWGPPRSKAAVQVRIERPGAHAEDDAGPPIDVRFDDSGICHVGVTLQRVWLGAEGVHALCLLAGGRVLVRRRFLVRLIPEWEWPKDEFPGAA